METLRLLASWSPPRWLSYPRSTCAHARLRGRRMEIRRVMDVATNIPCGGIEWERRATPSQCLHSRRPVLVGGMRMGSRMEIQTFGARSRFSTPHTCCSLGVLSSLTTSLGRSGCVYRAAGAISRLVYARCSAPRSLRLVLAEADVRLVSSPPSRSLLYPRSIRAVHVRAIDTPPSACRCSSSSPLRVVLRSRSACAGDSGRLCAAS
jgi:hypothetical protein